MTDKPDGPQWKIDAWILRQLSDQLTEAISTAGDGDHIAMSLELAANLAEEASQIADRIELSQSSPREV